MKTPSTNWESIQTVGCVIRRARYGMDSVQINDERAFGRAMTQIYHDARHEGYVASYFLRMLAEVGPIQTAKKLITSEAPSEGFARLFELGRLDLTVEALVLE